MTTRLSIANASQHLQHMRRAGLVGARRDGKFVYYRLADEAALDLLADSVGWRNAMSRNSNASCAAISMTEIGWSPYRATNCSSESARGRSRCWTCGRKTSSRSACQSASPAEASNPLRDQDASRRIGLASQQRLLDEQIVRFQDQSVSGNHVARCVRDDDLCAPRRGR